MTTSTSLRCGRGCLAGSSARQVKNSLSNRGTSHRLRSLAPQCSAQEPDPQNIGRNRSGDEFRSRLELARWSSAQEKHTWLNSLQDTLGGAGSSKDENCEFFDESTTPFANGLARTGSFDDEDIEFWTYSNPSSLVFGNAGVWGDLDQVYVILFGVGQSDTEGIYSLRALSRDDGLPQDTIIAFEDAEDAERYAGLLEATMDHYPSVCPIDPQELLEFCMESGYSCRLEARGSLLIPPDYNVGITDWERSLSLREGRWSVVDRDYDNEMQEVMKHFQYVLPTFKGSPSFFAYEQPAPSEESLSGAELEEIKRRLERLLPEE